MDTRGLVMIGWVIAGIVSWVAWTHRQHTKELKPLPTRQHHHWLHWTGEVPKVKARNHAKE
jgi:hypothetical protein